MTSAVLDVISSVSPSLVQQVDGDGTSKWAQEGSPSHLYAETSGMAHVNPVNGTIERESDDQGAYLVHTVDNTRPETAGSDMNMDMNMSMMSVGMNADMDMNAHMKGSMNECVDMNNSGMEVEDAMNMSYYDPHTAAALYAANMNVSTSGNGHNTPFLPFLPMPIYELEAVLASLVHQLDFYFSPVNLNTDTFLLSRMNEARFVPVDLICGFRRVAQLTTDRSLVVEAMRRSRAVQLDESEQFVRPNTDRAERSTVILRDISPLTPLDEMQALFDRPDSPFKPLEIKADVDNTWFVHMENEHACTETVLWLTSQHFQGQPVRARVKSENVSRGFFASPLAYDPYQSFVAAAYPYPMTYVPYGMEPSFCPIHAAPVANVVHTEHVQHTRHNRPARPFVRHPHRATSESVSPTHSANGHEVQGNHNAIKSQHGYTGLEERRFKKKGYRYQRRDDNGDGEHVQQVSMSAPTSVRESTTEPLRSIASPSAFPPMASTTNSSPVAVPHTVLPQVRPVLNYASRVGSMPPEEVAKVAAAKAAREAKTKPEAKESRPVPSAGVSAKERVEDTAAAGHVQKEMNNNNKDAKLGSLWDHQRTNQGVNSPSNWRDRHRKVIQAPSPQRYSNFHNNNVPNRTTQRSPGLSSASTDTASSTSSPSSPASSSSSSVSAPAANISSAPGLPVNISVPAQSTLSFAELLKRQQVKPLIPHNAISAEVAAH